MGSKLVEIVEYLNSELRITEFGDDSVNGLQVEASDSITKVAVSVDAGEQVIMEAIARKADLLIVHHGLFWGRPYPLTGPASRMMRAMFESKLSLYAAHLPLDAHENWGNNFALARMLELKNLRSCAKFGGQNIGCHGINSNATLDDIVSRLRTLVGAPQNFVTLPFGPKIPQRVAIVSGGAADVLGMYAGEDFDTFISGEPKQFAYHFAREHNLNAIFAGHYATETLGVQNLGKALQEKFGTTWEFLNVPTGI